MSGPHRSPYAVAPAHSTVHAAAASSPTHSSRAHLQLSMNAHDLSGPLHSMQPQQHPHHPQYQHQQHTHAPSSASPSASSPHHLTYATPVGHSYAPPLSPALYDSAPRSAGLLAAESHSPLDMSDGHPNSAGWLADSRMRSMSSDSAAVDYFSPSRAQSLGMDMATAFGQHSHGYGGHVGGDSAMQHMSPPVGGAADGPWTASAMYPPSSHTPTLSTASLSQPAAYGHIAPMYASPPVRAVYATPMPAAAAGVAMVYTNGAPHAASQRTSNGMFPSPASSRSIDSFSPVVHPSPYTVPQPPRTAANEPSSVRHTSPPAAQHVKLPPSAQQSALLPLSVQLRSGTGKKKIWPSRTVLSSPAWSFSQLLFHAANLSSFQAVSVEGQIMSNECRLRDSRAIGELLAVGGAEIGGVGDGDSGDGSAQTPKVEVVFDLPVNVKSCTRLGCPNLLVNKANRRACNICQSQGADLFPGQIRMVHLPYAVTALSPAASSTAAAYLELYLDQFEHWKFDGSEDRVQYIVFTDEATAQRVQSEMANNLNLQLDSHFSHPQQPAAAAAGTQQSMLQPVDPSYSYTIRMKSHFWMLQIKPLDGSTMAGGSKARLYKKVGKPNQSRMGEKHVKSEKDDDMSVAVKANGKADDSAQLGHEHTNSNHLSHSHHHLHSQNGNIASPHSDDSEGSSVHSYPSLPALAPHLLPSSPESFSDSSSALSSSPALPSHLSRKRQLDRDDMQLLVEDDGARRDSVTSDSSNSSSHPSSAPDCHALLGFDDGNELCVTEDSFYSMTNNKPVNAMMSVAPARAAHNTIVGAALTNEGHTAACAVGNGTLHEETAFQRLGNSASTSSMPVSSATVGSPSHPSAFSSRTPVVLVYRDIESYERERRRLKKDDSSRSSDKDRSQRRGGQGGGSGGRGEGGGGGDGGRDYQPPKEHRGDDDKDGGDDSSQPGKRRRYNGAGSSQRQAAGGGRQYSRDATEKHGGIIHPRGGVKVPRDVMPELRDSLLRQDSGGGVQLGDWKTSSEEDEDEDEDVGKHVDSGKFGIDIPSHQRQQQRMVALPADFADLLLDKGKMQQLYASLRDMPSVAVDDSSRSKLAAITNPAALARLRAIQSTSLSTWFNLFLGVVSLVLITLYITGLADDTALMKDAPIDQAISHGRKSLMLLQSSSAVSTMTAVSPVFASWALASSTNSTNSSLSSSARTVSGPGGGSSSGGGGSGGNNGRPGENTIVSSASVSDVVFMCIRATQVSKAIGDWLLDSQGLLPLYANFGMQDLVSPAFDSAATCTSLTNAVGFAHLKKLVCSIINQRVHGALIQSLAICAPEKGSHDFDSLMCRDLLDTLHTSNVTATVMLGLTVNDQSAAQAFRVVNQTFNDSSPITQYLQPLQPAVRVVEMAAMGYYLQSSSLSSVCTTYSVINHLELDFQQQQQGGGGGGGAPGGPPPDSDDSSSSGARMMHPAVLLVVLIGSGGMVMIAHALLFGVYRGSAIVYNKVKHAAS